MTLTLSNDDIEKLLDFRELNLRHRRSLVEYVKNRAGIQYLSDPNFLGFSMHDLDPSRTLSALRRSSPDYAGLLWASVENVGSQFLPLRHYAGFRGSTFCLALT